jgi:O-antigen ligase
MNYWLSVVAVAASMPMALVSISKLVLLLGAAITRLQIRRNHLSTEQGFLTGISFVNLSIYATVIILLISALWTTADPETAFFAFLKHSKILIIPLIGYIAYQKGYTIISLKIALQAQVVVLLLAFSFAAFGWIQGQALSNMKTSVFSESELDQSIMFVVSATILWFVSNTITAKAWTNRTIVVLFFAYIFLISTSRTAYIIALASISMFIIYLQPFKFKWTLVWLAPSMIAALIFVGSPQFQHRVVKAITELQAIDQPQNVVTSTGWRIHVWQRSVDAFIEQPLWGHGVGSWTTTVKRLESTRGEDNIGTGKLSNPHQEYLLYAVELGVLGVILKFLFFIATAIESLKFNPPMRQASIAVLVCIGLAGLFNSIIFDDLIGDFLMIMMGLCLAAGREQLALNHEKTERCQ